MSARSVIAEAAAHGVRLSLNGGNVRVMAEAKPSADILEKIRLHKPEILALLSGPALEEALAAPCCDPEPASPSSEDNLPFEPGRAPSVTDAEAAEAQFQAELAQLRAWNAAIYSKPTPWRSK